jgi:hypothetical protein
MKNLLVVVALCYALTPALSQDHLWMSPGIGLSGTKKSVMANFVLGATYLRNDRFGISFGAEHNGRMKHYRQSNSLQSFGNFHACAAWNLRPRYATKLIVRTGVSTGKSCYLGDFVSSKEYNGTVFIKTEKKYMVTIREPLGLYLSFEAVFEDIRYSHRCWSVELFSNLSVHSYAGLRLRRNFGGLF